MAVAAVSNSGTNGSKSKNFSSMFGGASIAKVSSTTGSPTITTDGSATVYKYTGTGNIVFSQAGYVRVLIVGGGGGGGTGNSINWGGGGGAGDVKDVWLYVDATTYTLTVPAGGAAGSGRGGRAFFGSLINAGGGFGGNGPNGGGGASGNGYVGAAGEGNGGSSTGDGSQTPTISSITGTATNYGGTLVFTAASGAANSGYGGSNSYNTAAGAGGSGVIIVRIG